MFDFNAISRSMETAKVTLEIPGLTPAPVFECRPATERNSGFHNAWAKHIRKRAAQGLRLDVDSAVQDRETDLRLIGNYCIVGWDPETVRDEHGKPAPYSPANRNKFIDALLDVRDDKGKMPDAIRMGIDAFRAELRDPETFNAATAEEVDAQVGNSPGG